LLFLRKELYYSFVNKTELPVWETYFAKKIIKKALSAGNILPECSRLAPETDSPLGLASQTCFAEKGLGAPPANKIRGFSLPSFFFPKKEEGQSAAFKYASASAISSAIACVPGAPVVLRFSTQVVRLIAS
jgi:hypothetical protein